VSRDVRVGPCRLLERAAIKLSRATLSRLLQQSNGPHGLKSGRAFRIKQKVRVSLQAKGGSGSTTAVLVARLTRPQYLGLLTTLVRPASRQRWAKSGHRTTAN
jgi:hypothetical protein